MRLIFKLILLFLLLTFAFVIVYEICGQSFESLFSQERCIEWFSRIKPLAWIIGIVLLISDILLPVPATGIMAALGAVYGPWGGGAASAAGSVCAGLIGYFIAKFFGQKASTRIASQEEVERFKLFFDRWGSYAVILSRIMPIIPEVTAILAGFSGMNFRRFLLALTAGSLPVSFLFFWMGSYSGFKPGIGILLAVLLPAFLWPFFIKLTKV
ncbi:TVP38/TMEM64 family protein [Desulfobacter curvatus]|uniref:TVP38/TMEM64 family protein n=1 Tax=Desulfobacter curvatus TaxID=2290 RepID=UPI00038130E5|nr:VTT domain-containing protein [Desulfobacter curvatus]